MSASFGIQKTAVGRQEGRRSRACNNHAATERQLRRTSIKICRGDTSQGVSTWQQGLALRSSCSDERSTYPRWQRIQSIEIERRCINPASAVSQLRANSCPLDPLLVTQGRSIATAKKSVSWTYVTTRTGNVPLLYALRKKVCKRDSDRQTKDEFTKGLHVPSKPIEL